VYRKTDTHWNDYGAFIGYGALMARLGKWFQTRPLGLDDYTVGSKTVRGGGLAGLDDLRDILTESVPVLTPRFTPCSRQQPLPLVGETHWNREQEPFISGCRSAEGPSAVLFRDSFVSAMVPFLSELFKKISYIWKPYDHAIMQQLIADDAPQLVIEGMVERHFFRGFRIRKHRSMTG